MDLLITMKYEILFFLMSYWNSFKLSNIILSVFSTNFNFAANTYGTLNMFLLSVQTNFYILLSSYVKGHMKKKSSLRFMYLVCFQVSKIWTLFGKFTLEIALKSFSGRNNSVEAPFMN